MVPRPLDRSGVEAQGEAGGEHNLTRTLGGGVRKTAGGVRHGVRHRVWEWQAEKDSPPFCKYLFASS